MTTELLLSQIYNKCIKCAEIKLIDEFYIRSKKDFRPRNTCKRCEIKFHTKYVKKNREKIRRHDKKYRERHPDIVKVRKLKYSKDNKERLILKKKNYYQNNKKVLIEKQVLYEKKNPEIRKVACANVRAKKLGMIDRITLDQVKNIFLAQKGKCNICLIEINDNYHLDHKIPFIKGGLNNIENIQLTCASCNLKKRDMTMDEYRIHLELKSSGIQGISKFCFNCKKVKPVNEFHKSKNEKDGLKRLCKPCKAIEYQNSKQ